MSKMHCFSNKFSKIAKHWGQRDSSFDFGDLKLRELIKLRFSNWLWRSRI